MPKYDWGIHWFSTKSTMLCKSEDDARLTLISVNEADEGDDGPDDPAILVRRPIGEWEEVK